MPTLSSTSSLTLLLHHGEADKPTNTGSLATRCLAGSNVVIVAEPGAAAAEVAVTPRSVLLFPSTDAVELTAAHGPVHLVVPDGTWRQARKMRTRVGGVADLPCVVLPKTTTSTTYRLRAERREGGMATLEAIAEAFRIVDGDATADAMLAVFRVMVDRTLWLRGQLRDDEVSGGIPEAARRHDPRGGLPKH